MGQITHQRVVIATSFFVCASLIHQPAWAKSSSVKKAAKKLAEDAARTIQAELVQPPKDNEVCFSPKGNCDVKLWKFIQSSQESLDIAIFDLTHPKIAHEIAAASKRIPVRVVVDRRQAKGPHSLVSMLKKAGVQLRIGRQRGIMHDKFTIVDKRRVEMGSFNYTDGATSKNSENQLYLSSPEIVGRYQAEFERLWAEGDSALAFLN